MKSKVTFTPEELTPPVEENEAPEDTEEAEAEAEATE